MPARMRVAPASTAVTSGSCRWSAHPCKARTACVSPLSQAYHARTTEFTSPLRIQRRRRDAVILAVDHLPHFHQRLAGPPHRHHVTRDVQANRSRRGVAGEGDGAVLVEGLDVAVAVALVAEPRAATNARDVLEFIAVV